MKRKFTVVVLSLILLAVCLPGCMLFRLKWDLEEFEKLAQLRGIVEGDENAPTVVALIKYNKMAPTLVNYKVLTDTKDYEFYVEPGNYHVYAYSDRNGDFKNQEDEPATRSRSLELAEGQAVTDVHLSIPKVTDPKIASAIQSLKKEGRRELPLHKERLGSLISIDSEYFTDENGSLGMWQPLTFVKSVPFGTFLLEEYSPTKTPVLFVHGISGHPGNFKDFIAGLDRSKYQPLVFFYPSGFRLEMLADFLAANIVELDSRHHFKDLHLVAHSMGGLVSRAALAKLQQRRPGLVKQFVSISSPFGGHAAARSGAESAPVVMPVWIDMSPDSEFLAGLFNEKLSAPHDMVFGYHGSPGLFGGNNDGVVSLASQLRTDAQLGARSLRGFDYNHMDILKAEDSRSYVYSLLE